ncbi:hypothetical protein BD414DRAFT_449173 [Trametes punicea]|nr:hypothetical protein BD414DRAFT_449173 [Trametes punicea]
MSRAHHLLLTKLCHNDDTLERAKSILHTASIKTAQGSGYELGQGLSGLPAICAYIAAEELGDNDVTEKIAQASSCLKPKVFKTALHTVKAALSAAASSAAAAAASPAKSTRNVTYMELLVEKKIGRRGLVLGWMQSTERTLMANREMRRKFGGAYDAITLAVFCWTSQLMGLKAQKIGAEVLLKRYDVPRDLFDEIVEVLHELCQDVAQEIKADIACLRSDGSPTKAAVSPTESTASPSKPEASASTRTQTVHLQALISPTPSSQFRPSVLTKSPSKSALRAPSADLTPRKTPSHKRKVAFDGPVEEEDEDAFDALATPSKRQKFSSSVKELSSTLAITQTVAGTPRKSSRLAHSVDATKQEGETVASSSRQTLDLLQRVRQADPVGVPSTPRRTRVTSQPSSTHSSRSGRSGRSQPNTPSRRKPPLPTLHEDEERMGRRRYRPAFADTQQWLKGDTRLERTLRPWTERWRELVGRCGGDIWEAARATGAGRDMGLVASAAT